MLLVVRNPRDYSSQASIKSLKNLQTCLWPVVKEKICVRYRSEVVVPWARYLDQELRNPQLTRGMTRIWNDVQSNLRPHFLQCPCGRRLMVSRK